MGRGLVRERRRSLTYGAHAVAWEPILVLNRRDDHQQSITKAFPELILLAIAGVDSRRYGEQPTPHLLPELAIIH